MLETQLTVISLLALVSVCRCYEFSSYNQADVRTKTRVRTCTPNAQTCYYCDCYNSPCNIPKGMRELNRHYRGLFTRLADIQGIIDGSTPVWTIKSSTIIASAGNGFRPGQPGPPGQPGLSIGCCDTMFTAVSPNVVELNGVTRIVVTPQSSNNLLTTFQIVWVGTCPSQQINRPCCNNGVCRNEVGFPTFILVHSTTNNFQYEFVPIVYSRFCKCARIAPGPPGPPTSYG